MEPSSNPSRRALGARIGHGARPSFIKPGRQLELESAMQLSPNPSREELGASISHEAKPYGSILPLHLVTRLAVLNIACFGYFA